MSRISWREPESPPVGRHSLSAAKHDAWAIVVGAHRPGSVPTNRAPGSATLPASNADLPLPERAVPARHGLAEAFAALMRRLREGKLRGAGRAEPAGKDEIGEAAGAPHLGRGETAGVADDPGEILAERPVSRAA